MMTDSFDGIVFDLYDTLVYISNRTRSFRNFLKDVGVPDDDMRYWFDLVLVKNFSSLYELQEAIVEKYKDHYDIQIRDCDVSKHERNLEAELNSVALFDDTIETLKRLKSKYRLFLLSNASTQYKIPFFKHRLNIYFEKWFFSCDLGLKKPDKAIFYNVIDWSLIDPSRLLMIGDSLTSDYEGALGVEMKAVLKNDVLKNITKEL